MKGALQLLINRYGYILFAHVHAGVSNASFVVLIIENSKLKYLGAHGTVKSRSSSYPHPVWFQGLPGNVDFERVGFAWCPRVNPRRVHPWPVHDIVLPILYGVCHTNGGSEGGRISQ